MFDTTKFTLYVMYKLSLCKSKHSTGCLQKVENFREKDKAKIVKVILYHIYYLSNKVEKLSFTL